MDNLVLGFTDTIESIAEFFIDVLSKDFNVLRDDQNPDYLIFGDKNFGQNNLQYNTKNCVKIFFTGENERPWDYPAHFSLSFDHIENEHHYRLPLYVIYDWDNQRRKVYHAKNRRKITREEKEFCSFVVKNGSCEKRNNFFHKLSTYKQVTSAGPLFNNTGFILPGGPDAVNTKLDFLPKYKFNMCFENSSYPGYATEKIYDALIARVVPIYWGSTTIDCDFNPKAFLNWHDYKNDDDFIRAIKMVDESPYLYDKMLEEPMFRDPDPLACIGDEYPFSNKYMDMYKFRKWFKSNVYVGMINKRMYIETS